MSINISIYGRLFLWFCAANLLTLGASILIAHAIFERSADRPPNIDALVAKVEQDLRSGSALPEDRDRDGRRWFLLRDGLALSGQSLPGPVARNLNELAGERAELKLPRGVWLASRRIRSAPSETLLVVMQGPLQRRSQARWLTLGLQLGLSLIAIAGVGWVVARHLSRPLERIQSAVRKVAAGDLSSRVGEDIGARGDEYGRLAQDFDRMATQIESLVDSRDQLLHDVSHELRAPLSRLRFALELAREDASSLERADREIARIDALVGELLALARLDSANREWPQIELAELVQDVIEAERPEAAHRGVRLEFSGAALSAAGERESLTRALENVVRNAVRHSPDGAGVEVALRAEGECVRLSVRDRGTGVSAEELPRLFEPFFRGSSATGADGYGLGLAIVARVMRAHRGQAEGRRRENGGLEVMLRWPRKPV